MIVKLKGYIEEKTGNSVYLNVCGVYYEVFVSQVNLLTYKDNSECEIYIKQIITETSSELYGFKTKTDRDFFEYMIGFKGLGAKTIMSILNEKDISDIAQMLHENDIDSLCKLPRIGRKSAEKILMEFRQKVKKFDDSKLIKTKLDASIVETVKNALSQIGFNTDDAYGLCEKYYKEGMTISNLISEIIKKK